MLEKFDPNKFKAINDIPEKLQKNFVKVLEEGSFVRKEAHENDEWAQEKADKINKLEATQPFSNTKVEAIDLIHGKALEEHRKIEEKYTEKVSGLEETLGIGLSENSRKQIYSQISAEHQEETMSAQERGDRHDEQEIYKNEQVIAKSKDVLAMTSEALSQLPDEKRREMVRDLKWNRFADRFGSGRPPEEVLEAEAKIFKIYKPSSEIQAIHMENADALLEMVANDFSNLNEKWNAASVDEKKEICKTWADFLSDRYKIPRVKVVISDRDSGETGATYNPSSDPGVPDAIELFEKKLRSGTMRSSLFHIRHEMSHSFQQAAVGGFLSEEIMTKIANDIEWFRLKEERNNVRDTEIFKESHARYLSLPDEQDAHLADQNFSKKIDAVFSQSQDRLLGEAGLEDLEAIRLNGNIARTARRMIGNRQIINSNQLLELAKAELSEKAVSLFENIFSGKTGEECFQIIKQFEDKEDKSNELLKAA